MCHDGWHCFGNRGTEGGREGMRVPMPKRGKWLKIDRGTDGREREEGAHESLNVLLVGKVE